MSVLSGISPTEVFRFFEEICNIPHGSRDTKKISDYLVEFAKERNLKYIQDELNNVIIFKPGTKGYENSEAVIIQGHMDMVCEKEKDFDIDFTKDGLKLRVDGNFISAEGTTLGGDDGIAVAFALALLDSDGDLIPHPPLEVVITVDEEIGMLGAAGLDCSMLKAKTMLNIDSEDEGILLVSCAGGATASCELPVSYEDVENGRVAYTVTVTGIAGGHSGIEIHKQGANSNKILGRILYNLNKLCEFDIVSVNGGLKDNAIPRESIAVLSVSHKADIDKINSHIKDINDILRSEYISTDKEIKVLFEKSPEQFTKAMTKADTKNVITALMSLPNGVERMSNDIEGLVQTSLNMGILKTEKEKVIFNFSVRSSVGSEKCEVNDRLSCIMDSLGGNMSISGDYPAWEYRQESKLRDLMVKTYEDLFAVKPEIQAVHAGLECGLFAGKIPGLDCVSFGPQMDDIHTTSERLYIDSVNRCWEYTKAILKGLK